MLASDSNGNVIGSYVRWAQLEFFDGATESRNRPGAGSGKDAGSLWERVWPSRAVQSINLLFKDPNHPTTLSLPCCATRPLSTFSQRVPCRLGRSRSAQNASSCNCSHNSWPASRLPTVEDAAVRADSAEPEGEFSPRFTGRLSSAARSQTWFQRPIAS